MDDGVAICQRLSDRDIQVTQCCGLPFGFHDARGKDLVRAAPAFGCTHDSCSARVILENQWSAPTTCSMQVFSPWVEKGLVRKLFMPNC